MQPPQFGKKASTRDLIIKILSEEPSLSVKQLHERVTKRAEQNITYQAVHKCVLQLLGEGIIDKTGATFQISKKWLEEIKKFGEKTSLDYNAQNKNSGKTFSRLIFNNFMDLGRYTINEFFVFPNPENKPAICCFYHTWGPIGATEQEFENLKKLFSINKHYSISVKDTFLDRYFADFLSKMGKICKTGISFFPEEIFVQGDFVAQVFYPLDYLSKIDKIFSSTSNIQEFDLAKIMEIYGEHHKIYVLIFEDKEVADLLRKQIMEKFEE